MMNGSRFQQQRILNQHLFPAMATMLISPAKLLFLICHRWKVTLAVTGFHTVCPQ
jgi:hypothetical protein